MSKSLRDVALSAVCVVTFLSVDARAGAAPQPQLMTPKDLQALRATPADVRSSYGTDDNQFGELRLPPGPGPHPVAILVHGGCFMAAYATLSDLAPMGDALKARGIASWNVEYRRLHQPGSGWPGTYLDVGAAVDHLRVLARMYPLDLDRVVLVGHSAGGHLAVWAAARHRIRTGSEVHRPDPLRVRGVVDLAGATDRADDVEGYERVCGAPVITDLMGGSPVAVPERYSDASPRRWLPLGVRQVIVVGEHEDQVPIDSLRAHVDAARRAGDDARLELVPRAGHFEIASPQSAAWVRIEAAIRELLEQR